ncbi:hypothetical protein EYF80_013443 [Liparis tanakae]|uniref:Uncharacterized protein n=1 Tax=Liparis tanakae TaxID=230148 RepID=A0A4Z2IG20_9TELE|nr:hypothetical protein EYF80_013443 [Liparis tanakae]
MVTDNLFVESKPATRTSILTPTPSVKGPVKDAEPCGDAPRRDTLSGANRIRPGVPADDD